MKPGVYGHDTLTADQVLTCEVCVIGSGAGGATLAEGLTAAGLDVVMLEAGSHHHAGTFSQDEREAYPRLYQDRAARATVDGAITVLQGRSVGGGTTVNWTTCFRTPQRVLDHWGEVHGLGALGGGALDPHFEAMEQRLNIGEWPESAINGNNRALLEGCRALGWQAAMLRRNVRGCRNSGLCGLGCPYDAKQGMGVTTIAAALASGGLRLLTHTRARALTVSAGRVAEVHAEVLRPDSAVPAGVRLVIRPKVTVIAGGAINSPALLLRSDINPGGLVGLRTFLHPVVGLAALYPHRVEGWAGAPQSAASHHFAERGEGEVGFFMETTPLQPLIAAGAFPALSPSGPEFMRRLPHLGNLISLCIDGLHPESEGGRVTLGVEGHPRLSYPVTAPLIEAMGAAHVAMAKVALAAGAERLTTYHARPVLLRSEADLARLAAAPFGPGHHAIFSAHQMGGCAMGADPARSVVDPEHRLRGLRDAFVVDGSVLPTSLGVNPSLTLYAMAHRARGFVIDAARA